MSGTSFEDLFRKAGVLRQVPGLPGPPLHLLLPQEERSHLQRLLPDQGGPGAGGVAGGLAQDSPEEPVGVSYCHLSSPGYREDTLRRGEQETLGARTEEFTVTGFQRGSGRSYKSWDGNNGMYDVRSMNISPNSSSSFDADSTYLTAKKSGLFAVSSSDFYIFQDNIMISFSLKAAGMVQLGKGEKLHFQIASSRPTSLVGKILITEIN